MAPRCHVDGPVLGAARRHRLGHHHRADHRVLHRHGPGQADRGVLEDRARHQHHRRPRGRDGKHHRAGAAHLRRHLGRVHGRRPLRHRDRRRRHAGDGRRHDVGRRLRPDRRQRRRHRRDEPPRQGSARHHRRPRCPRQHHRRHRQGLRHRFGGADRAGPVLRLRLRRRPQHPTVSTSSTRWS